MNEMQEIRRKIVADRFKEAVKEYMAENHLTQQKLADQAGMTRSVIANIMGGRMPSFDTAVILSKVMGKGLDEIESGSVADVTDIKYILEGFKKNAIEEVQKALDRSDYYGDDEHSEDLTQDQKDTIMRLVRAYLNVTKTGSIRKKG